ncbi:WD40 repeat domain-containing serine/threonine-protein kinase [Thermogemmatispora carboxidivorans]|uniref:WD40 repeat domain-containing serine/threonine-protein kinase n=1 Tax=Thermogemmatispora carboxidivorans TaxID=1382306 RepID=UPI00069BFD8A|nr:WD40 repeat domain-containing serine/threonine-protein kinase [Thermogemmatispora carboxidivorans]
MSTAFTQERFCDHCGAANPLDATQCWHCQAPLTPPEAGVGTLLIGRYQLIRELGQGGMGTVFLGEDRRLGARPVAVKCLSKRRLNAQERAEAERAFQQEAELLARLHHPSLPAIHDYWSEPEASYLVMDYIEGETLEAIQQRTPQHRLPLEQVVEWGEQLCEVLAYLHEQQPPVIFRDLKPANVMVRQRDGRLLLIDFGIARHFKAGQAHDTMAFGSPGFAAPEQYGKEQTTPRSDLYSLGAVLHSLLSGRDPSEQPFRFAPLRQLNPEVPEELAQLIGQLLVLDVERRPSSARAVGDELRRLAQDLPARRNQSGSGVTTTVSAPAQAPAGRPAPPAAQPQRGPVSPPRVPILAPSPAAPTKSGTAQTPLARVRGRLQVLAATLPQAPQNRWPGLSRRTLLAGGLGIGATLAGLAGFFLLSRPRLPELATNGSGALRLALSCQGHTGSVTALAWSPNGAVLASASRDQTVRLWDPMSGQIWRVYRGHRSEVRALAWSPDGLSIASGSADGFIHIWDVVTGRLRLSYQQQSLPVTSLLWLAQANGSLLASAGGSGCTYLWDSSRGELVAAYCDHTGDIRALASQSSTDSGDLASGGDDSLVVVRDAISGLIDLVYRGHQGPVWSVAWSPDNSMIVSGSQDATAQIWDPRNGEPLLIYKGHINTVTGVGWSPQGEQMASCSYDGTVQVWECTTGKLLGGAKTAPLQALAWSPISDLIATGDQRAQVQLWRIS